MMEPDVTQGAVLELIALAPIPGQSSGVNSPFITTWPDTSGSGYNATLHNMAGTNVSGWAGSGWPGDPNRLVYDGVDDYVDIGTGLASLYSTKVFSVEAWAGGIYYSGVNHACISLVKDNAFTNAFYIDIEGSSGASAHYVANGKTVVDTVGSGNIFDGRMHHLVATVDGSYLRFYKDGDLWGAPRAIPADAFGTITKHVLGGDGWIGWKPSSLAAYRVYPFTLSLAQIQTNYTAVVDRMVTRPQSTIYNGTWVRQGVVSGNSALGEGTTYWNGTVWQSWSCGGANAQYATAPALTGPWTRGANQPLSGHSRDTFCRMQVRVINGTYHCTLSGDLNGDGGYSATIEHFTSNDGLTWTWQDTALTLGSAGTWDSLWFGNHEFWLDADGTYYLMYEAGSSTSPVMKLGMATASSMNGPWTKYSLNPVLGTDSCEAASPTVLKKQGVYYCFFIGGHGSNLPTDILRARSNHPLGPWSIDCWPLFARTTTDEGVGWYYGEVADPEVLEYYGKLYMFYNATTDGHSGGSWCVKYATCDLGTQPSWNLISG